MTDFPSALAQAVALISGGQRFLCTAHARLDGDALGAMLTTAAGLRALGKEVHLYNQDKVPRRLLSLPGASTVRRRLPSSLRCDATLVHDTGARHLLGEHFPPSLLTGPLIVVDHHLVADDFGAINLRDPAAASAGVVAARLLFALGLREDAMPLDMAHALFVSIVEDTGWFRYPSTNPEALRLAASCLARGVQPWAVARPLDEENPESSLRLLTLVLPTLARHCDGKLAILTLSDDLLHKAGATGEEAGKLVNYARGLRGVEVGVLLTLGDKTIYASLRSKGALDVAQVAQRFGGGGHRNAAGCTLPASPDAESRAAAQQRLIDALGEAFAALRGGAAEVRSSAESQAGADASAASTDSIPAGGASAESLAGDGAAGSDDAADSEGAA